MLSPFCNLSLLSDLESQGIQNSIDIAATSIVITLPPTPAAARHYPKHCVNAVLRALGQMTSFWPNIRLVFTHVDFWFAILSKSLTTMPAKQSGADDGYMMHTVLGRGYGLNDPEILIWGFMEIHFSVKNMQKSLPAEAVSGAMQLVCVADSTLLQSMLLPGT